MIRDIPRFYFFIAKLLLKSPAIEQITLTNASSLVPIAEIKSENISISFSKPHKSSENKAHASLWSFLISSKAFPITSKASSLIALYMNKPLKSVWINSLSADEIYFPIFFKPYH